MDASTVEALSTLSGARPAWIGFELFPGIAIDVFLAIACSGLLAGAIAGNLSDVVKKKRRGDEIVASVFVGVFLLVAAPAVTWIYTSDKAADREYEETAAAYEATVGSACPTILDAIAQGQVTILTDKVTRIVEGRCGAVEFMAAVNAPTARVDFAASEQATARR